MKKKCCSYFFHQSAFHTQKFTTHCKEENKKNNYDNYLNNKKIIQSKKLSKKCPKNSKLKLKL